MAKAAKTKTVTVKVNEENPEPLEVLARAVIDVADGFEKIQNSRLQKRAIILLLHDLTGVRMNDIINVLDAGVLLKKKFIKDLPKK